jgi:hypothetical protein
MRKLKPFAGLQKVLCVLIQISIAITIVAVMTDLYDIYSYIKLPRVGDFNDIVLPADVIISIVGLVQVGLGIFLIITFLRWIYRTNKNLRYLSGEQMKFTPDWSVGWFFIPIANVYKP